MNSPYIDYISNPKSDKWNKPPYTVESIYRAHHIKSGTTKYTTIYTRTRKDAQDLVDYWNSIPQTYATMWLYELVS